MLLLDQYGRAFPGVEQSAGPALNLRQDRWENGLTGIGTGADKSAHGRFFPVYRVLDQELTSLHNGSDLAAHVVDRRPKEMFRRGYDIEADGISASQTEAVREYATDVLDLDTNLREGFRWGRLYGGCLLLLNVDDGGYPWEPLDEENIRGFYSVSLVDRRYSYVQSQYSSLNGGKYGRPEIYLISNAVAVSGWNSRGTLRKKTGWELMREGGQATLVHESRVIRFDGNDADIVTRQQLAGWSWSVLQRVYDAMRQFEHAYDSVGYLLSDASQGVFKLQGLIKAITSGQRAAFSTRLQLMEMSRSVMRGIALDAGDGKGIPAEEFKREATSFASIPELLDRMMLRFAAACEEPSTILFGRAPGGLNASGDNELRAWYDTIASEQENELSPRLKRLYRLIGLAKSGPIKGGKDLRFKVHHKPLWSPTDKEKAATLLTNAQRDKIYLDDQVVKPEEVAVDLGDIYPNLDVEAREAVLKSNKSFNPYPGDPKPKPGAPVSPTSASGVNGTAGEPIGGPQVPLPLFGGGSIGPAKPAKGAPAATLGTPDDLRKKSAVPDKDAAAKDDAHDPRQPRNQGKLSAHTATSVGVHAYDLSDVANTGQDIDAHHEAATAHAHAALDFRQLAARHERLGNAAAAKRHGASAAEHDAAATTHTMRAGWLGGGKGDGDTIVKQTTTYTCGVAALRSVMLDLLGSAPSQADLENDLEVDPDDGADVDALVRVARAHDLEAHATINSDPAQISSMLTRGSAVVALFQSEDGPADGQASGHYVRIVSVTPSAIVYVDSSRGEPGRRTISPDDFVARWHAFGDRDDQGCRPIVRKLALLFSAPPKGDGNPDQARDEQGRFGEGGGSSSSSPKGEGSADAPREATAAEFKGAFDSAFKDSAHAAFVTHYTAAELAGMKTYLAHDGKVGVAVHDHGDGRIEATALFNAGGPPGAGVSMLQHVIEHDGVNYVECDAPKLNALYASLGFKETGRAPFEPKYAPNWNTAKFGTPDYVTMKR